MMRSVRLVVLFVLIAATGCEVAGPDADDALNFVRASPGFGPVPSPSHNPTSARKVELGEALFFDPVLSRDGTISCGTCHRPERAFAESVPVSVGIEGRVGIRNSPTLVNVAYRRSLFWDGGSLTLENQVVSPLENEVEMDADLATVLGRLNADPEYRFMFEDAFGDSATVTTMTQAIAAFQRTIVGSGAPYDRYAGGQVGAISESAKRGLALFEGKAGCAGCHSGPAFTDDSFRNNGIRFQNADSGRARITLSPDDFAKFRVPTLRNVEITPPYMHDGRFFTLEEVVTHYDSGGTGARGQDPAIRPLNLSAQERADLVAFLRSLSDDKIYSGMPE